MIVFLFTMQLFCDPLPLFEPRGPLLFTPLPKNPPSNLKKD